ncbi:MAG: NTP transferase domain-containing protein [Candidatus Ratteibacteria bacterium]|nr:NTP transferase domain-containing protein [Candidatus Ratteibacteria bacterium]
MTSNNIKSFIRQYSSAIDYKIPCISIILAAGHGKRMKSSKPKVLYEILGVPTVIRVSEAAKKGISSPNQIIVVGVKAEEVIKAIGKRKNTCFVYQEEQKGTGNAVKVALEGIDSKFKGFVYILPADAGLITEGVIKDFKDRFEKSDCDMLMLTGEYRGETAKNHYGRVIKDKRTDEVIEIKEYKDIAALNDMYKIVHRGKALSFTRDELLDIREYNSSIYACKIEPLKKYLSYLEPTNVQKEYYFTDMIKIFNKHNLKVGSQTVKNSDFVMGFNDRATLKKMDALARHRTY